MITMKLVLLASYLWREKLQPLAQHQPCQGHLGILSPVPESDLHLGRLSGACVFLAIRNIFHFARSKEGPGGEACLSLPAGSLGVG